MYGIVKQSLLHAVENMRGQLLSSTEAIDDAELVAWINDLIDHIEDEIEDYN